MFLTLEDPRAKIQGSRDPLGVQPVWTRFGRRVVTNLTTVTTSVRGFTTLLLGRYFGEVLIEEGAAGEQDALSIFLRMEQICGYARFASGDDTGRVLGVQRIRKFLEEGGSTVAISTDPSGLILGDQKTYGLWGLYTVSARVSGLLKDGPVGLTPAAREFVEGQYLPAIRQVEGKLRKLLQRGGRLSIRKNDKLFASMMRILQPKLSRAEVNFYSDYLRDARNTGDHRVEADRQSRLASLLVNHADPAAGTGRDEVTKIARAADAVDEGLERALRRILRIEALIAPMENVFALLLARNGQTPKSVGETLRDRWGAPPPRFSEDPLDPLVNEILEAAGPDQVQLMRRADAALWRGDYESLVRTLIDWNTLIMDARGGARWVRLVDDKLDVRFRGFEEKLPDRKGFRSLWRNSYFIDALKAISHQLEGKTS